MHRNRYQVFVITTLSVLILAACESSSRFGGGSPAPGRVATGAPPPFIAAPTAPVATTNLPPPVSAQPLPAPNLPPPGGGPQAPLGLPPAGQSMPIDPDASRRAPEPPRVQTPPPAPPPVAAARPEPAPVSGAPTRNAVIGNWSAKEAAGTNCRVTLSSTPSLDLYKASSAGCQTRELQRVSAWELRGEEIYLYEPGGGVAARLKQSGRNFEGSAARTGAAVTLSK
jgi:Protease inhibitor Inh